MTRSGTASPIGARRSNLFGAPILGLPGLSHPDGSQGGGSGLPGPRAPLQPRATASRFARLITVRLAPNRDLTITPHVFTGVLPMLEAEYRAADPIGAFQVHGYVTYGSRIPARSLDAGRRQRQRAHPRLYRGQRPVPARARLERHRGRAATPPTAPSCAATTFRATTGCARWSTPSGSPTTAISRSPAGRSRGCGSPTSQGPQPIALPAIDARWRLADPVLGGPIELQANSLAIIRTDGPGHASAPSPAPAGIGAASRRSARRWCSPPMRAATSITPSDTLLTQTVSYRGRTGWNGRGIGALAARHALAVRRRLPRRHPALHPARPVRRHRRRPSNLEIPNEDARSVDLEDSNLFALNRFPGYDRWEDGVPRHLWRRLGARPARRLGPHRRSARATGSTTGRRILPAGTGLSDRFSDIVGRTDVQYRPARQAHPPLPARQGQLRDPPQRDRRDDRRPPDLCDDRLSPARPQHRLRRSRICATARRSGSAAGSASPRYWSIFGSTVIDLTSRKEDPLSRRRRLRPDPPPARHRSTTTIASSLA